MDIKTAFPYGVRSPAEIPNVADGILAEYFEITYRLGIRAAVILGVCLGFVRDGAYLPGDNDLDVVAIAEGLDREYLIKRLIDAGYLMGQSYPANNTHFVKDGVLLDVFWRTGRERFYAEFGSVPYKGMTAYPIPTPTDEYLTACYGDWRDKTNIVESKYEG